MERKFYKEFIRVITNRLMILMLIFAFGFWVLIQRLFDLQIVNSELYVVNMHATISRVLSVPAIRGSIYDRYGRPLAVNQTAFCVQFDPGVYVEDLNTVIRELLELFEENGISYVDELPITKEEPYSFTFSSSATEKRWKQDMGLENNQLEYTAAETMEHFKNIFNISPGLPAVETRNIVSLRSMIFMQRFRQYNIITLARDVNRQAVIDIEEQGERFPGIYINAESLRYYPEGEYVSHLLGYIRRIDQDEYENLKDSGYSNTDLIGKLGIEKAYEHVLSGAKGTQIVEMTTSGKVAGRVTTVEPVSGGNVYLTLDIELQKKVSDILLKNLKEVLIYKLDAGDISVKQLISSMIKSNNISIKKILNSEANLVQNDLRALILGENPDFEMKNINDSNSDDMIKAKETLLNAIENNILSPSKFLLCLNEQGVIACDEETLANLRAGKASSIAVIKEKIMSDEITPQTINLDPCTGSVAVVDVTDGDVLALVTYPSYDNNKLVNNFNNEYYMGLINDPTTPLVNRPLTERKAPGSTFKMLSAIAGLESGVITPTTKIQDKGVFESAGKPYANCLIYSRYGSTHGAVNVSKAIEVSCNYFFYEMAYRMGNAKTGTSLVSIEVLNDYMRKFGLYDYSGLGIEEYRPKPASPEEKGNSSGESWTDGDTIRSAIGQSVNSYTSIHMAKYIATLANGGTRYSLSLVGGIKEAYESQIRKSIPYVEEQFTISPENLKAVHDGMLAVTRGSQGSLRNLFSDFPINVAGKTGTAEESSTRPSHTWFTGFAPYENPQIAVVVMIPFGETASSPAPKIAKEIIAEYFNIYDELSKTVTVNQLVE